MQNLTPDLAQAKAWYESNFPVSSNSSKLITQSINGVSVAVPNLSQLITPDWQHPATYSRLGSNVIEMPVSNTSSINMALSNQPGGKAVYKSKYSRTSFLLLKDSTGYNAYVMTIIADSAYLKNDLTKLVRNKYNKRDVDFSGVVLYSTPKGKFVSAWFYKNGSISGALSPNHTIYTTINAPGSGNGLTTQSLKTDEVAITICLTWTQTVTVNGTTYGTTTLGSQCDTFYYDDDDGGGGGGGTTGSTSGSGSGSPSTTPPPCAVPAPSTPVAQSVSNGHLTVDVAQPAPTPTDPGAGDGDGGFPPPTNTPQPCTTVTTTTTTITNADIASATYIGDSRTAINPQDYINCFTDGKTASGYRLTIYVNQPVPGSNDWWSTDVSTGPLGEVFMTPGGQHFDVGHTFVAFEKDNTDGTSVIQVMGFYPNTKGVLPGIISKGIIKDDSGHPYNVKFTMDVAEGQFTGALSMVLQDNASANYVLSNIEGSTERNCTDAALSWIDAAGIALPNTPRGMFNNTPGDFGQALSTFNGATTTTGTAPQSHGACN